MEIADTIKFSDICVMLDTIKKASSTSKEKYLRRYYESFKKHRDNFRAQNSLTEDEQGGSSFYCVLRCLIPGADTARKPYGLQITALGKVYIKVLQLAPDSRDAQRLHHRSYSSTQGDYADIVHSVLKTRVQQQASELSLKQVHEMLDNIATDDRKNTEKVLTRLSEIAPAQEQMWFIRLLLKSMHLNIGEQRIFALLHAQAKQLYQRCTSLLRVCCLLADNKITLNSSINAEVKSEPGLLNLNEAIEPFQAVRPMLCEIFPGNLQPLMAADLLFLETKMDGERFQLHYKQGRFKYISRNGIDYTYAFGDSYSSAGSLTPQLTNLLPIGMQSIILDGEMMVWDIENARFKVKGEQTDVKHLENKTGQRPCFVVYDMLYLNGRNLLDMPYVQRTFKLRELIKEQPGVLQTMKPQKIVSLAEFKRLFQAALDADEEGVVLKKQNSVYCPGVRQGAGWYKVKADYIKGLTTEFDLLIMGGYYNRTRTFIESFLLGVLKYETAEKFKLYSVGKVTNITRQRVVLNNMLKPHWRDVTADPPPMWYHYSKFTPEGRPDVWLEPRNSTILQIKAADLAPSSAFALQKSLHFPRVESWRNDKLWNECMTLQEYLQMSQNKKGIKKINKRELCEEDFTTDRKRYKLTPAEKRKQGLQVYEGKVNEAEIAQTSELFAGLCFCILSGCLRSAHTPEQLKQLVLQNAGKIVENPKEYDASCVCIAGDITFRVELLQKKQRHNIASVNWLLKVCERQEMQLKPQDMLSMTDDLRAQFEHNFDVYGDSYTSFLDVSELKQVIDEITVNAEQKLSSNDFFKMEKKLYKAEQPNFFRQTCAYFYTEDIRSKTAEMLYKWRAGICIPDTSNQVELQRIDFIFINKKKIAKDTFMKWLKQHFQPILSRLRIVDICWILDSDKAKQKLDILEFTWHNF